MRAWQLVAWDAPPELREIPEPEPGPGEVVVAVAGCGLCHSDLHVLDGAARDPAWALPFTLGHETAGTVAAIGAGVTAVAPGDPVAVVGSWSCGRCRACRAGRDAACAALGPTGAAGGGLGRDGGMADMMLVPDQRLLVALPAGLDPRDAAPLTDAAVTPYHALKAALPHLTPGATLLVIGIGGLGHLALQLARALAPGVEVVAVDRDPERLALARTLGAHTALTLDDAIEDLGDAADVVLDLAGTDATARLATRAVRRGGHVALVGLGGGAARVGAARAPYETTFVASYWGTIAELHEVLQLAAAGAITPHTERFALADVATAVVRLRAGTLSGRAVICP